MALFQCFKQFATPIRNERLERQLDGLGMEEEVNDSQQIGAWRPIQTRT
jgi:hypothetical protein